jgi:alkylation response protein AidB-like acyl-CoA dehydrogenase
MVQSRIGAMARKVETIRAVARRATEYSLMSPAKHPYYTGGSKVTCTELAFEVASEALQLFGGNGSPANTRWRNSSATHGPR